MKPITATTPFKEDTHYLIYFDGSHVENELDQRKDLLFVKFNPESDEFFLTCGMCSRGNEIDDGWTLVSTEDGLISSEKKDEIFELTDSEILKHILIETI